MRITRQVHLSAITKKRWLAPGTPHQTPYYLFESSVRGQTVIIIAGIHGNERASVAAAQRLLRRLQSRKERIRKGTLILVPLVHQHAYKRNKRGKPDLNRTFPRRRGGKARHPLSAALMRLARRSHPAWYIDMHEANGLSQLNPRVLGQTLIVNPGSKAIPAARRTVASINRTIRRRAHRFTTRIRNLAGSGRQAAWLLHGARAITVETSWSLPRAQRISDQLYIVRRLLREAGM